MRARRQRRVGGRRGNRDRRHRPDRVGAVDRPGIARHVGCRDVDGSRTDARRVGRRRGDRRCRAGVASRTLAVTTAPAWFTTKRGAGDQHVSRGGVESTRKRPRSRACRRRLRHPGSRHTPRALQPSPTGAPPPPKGQPSGRSANVAGATGGSSTQRVSVTSPAPSAATRRSGTGDTYQPPLPFGADGVGETVVTGGVVSVNTEQVNARGVTRSDQPLSVPHRTARRQPPGRSSRPWSPRPFSRDTVRLGPPAPAAHRPATGN